MRNKELKEDKLPLLGGLALLLGATAFFMSWFFSLGGLIFGIPGLLLAIYTYQKGHRLLGVFAMTFSCLGIAAAFAIGIFSVKYIIPTPKLQP